MKIYFLRKGNMPDMLILIIKKKYFVKNSPVNYMKLNYVQMWKKKKRIHTYINECRSLPDYRKEMNQKRNNHSYSL